MDIEDGHLVLSERDLLPEHRADPPRPLRPEHFTREARIAAWYAAGAGQRYTVTYVGRSRGEVLTYQFRSDDPGAVVGADHASDRKLEFGDLEHGEHFVCWPVPGDDSGHGGYLGAQRLFVKTGELTASSVDGRGVESSMIAEMHVIRVLPIAAQAASEERVREAVRATVIDVLSRLPTNVGGENYGPISDYVSERVADQLTTLAVLEIAFVTLRSQGRLVGAAVIDRLLGNES